MPEEMTVEQEIDRIFANLGQRRDRDRGGRPADRGRLDPEPEDQEPEGADGDADDWDQD